MMVTTSFLSMWLSNTASTAMMLPIANAILKSLFGEKEVRKDPGQESEENTGEAVQRNWGQLHQDLEVGMGCPKDVREGQGHAHLLSTCYVSGVLIMTMTDN